MLRGLFWRNLLGLLLTPAKAKADAKAEEEACAKAIMTAEKRAVRATSLAHVDKLPKSRRRLVDGMAARAKWRAEIKQVGIHKDIVRRELIAKQPRTLTPDNVGLGVGEDIVGWSLSRW